MEKGYIRLKALLLICVGIQSIFFFAPVFGEEKWIVVTTIQHPTETLKRIAATPGWRVVVVADKKTPQDWQLDNCDFLSLEKQKELGYSIVQYLPFNSYSRKNIGYLYAIANGATEIYETDDDNYLVDGIPYVKEGSDVKILENGDFLNVYAYFGQPTMWPRGYSLRKIMHSRPSIETVTKAGPNIGIVQGLVDKDPDVDAIFRLTQERESYFSPNLPCVLKRGTFCPFNTQNTLIFSKAFWSLLLPTTVTMRVCDIWRGYISQRLLWEADLNLCFVSANAIQERNLHDYLKDFDEELELYLKADALVNFLGKWEDASPRIEMRFLNLIKALCKKNFLKENDYKLAEAWIQDLTMLGYEFPPVSEGEKR